VARFALFSLLALALGFTGLMLAIFNSPLFDPAPKGEGSFQEADAITRQFRNFYRTKDASLLPEGYVRLKGLGEKDLDGTWIVYYATASHGWVRGGTIMLLDSTGRIDTYFGHHCSSADGGAVIVSGPNLIGAYYEGGVESVRSAFSKAFKHQKTEQAGASDGDKPPS
jgi:hypothetical protein